MSARDVLPWTLCRRCWRPAYLLSYFDVPLCRGHVHEIAEAFERSNSWPDLGARALDDDARERVRTLIAERNRP